MNKITFLILSLSLFSGSCTKDNNNNIPLVNVDLFLHTTDPLFISLNAVGGWIYLNGGSRGLIVYKASNTEFKVYDRHCTYEPSNACALVSVEANNILGFDDCCGSRFILAADGSVSNGPAVIPLKQYRTTFDGSVLHISN